VLSADLDFSADARDNFGIDPRRLAHNADNANAHYAKARRQIMNEAKQVKYILGRFAAKNRAADSPGHDSASVHGTSRNLDWRRRIGVRAPIENTEISAKLAAFAAALTMNGLLTAGMAYLFNAPLERHTTPLERHAASIVDSGTDEPQPFYRREKA
jgi:hypothetical protein